MIKNKKDHYDCLIKTAYDLLEYLSENFDTGDPNEVINKQTELLCIYSELEVATQKEYIKGFTELGKAIDVYLNRDRDQYRYD